MTGRHPNRYGCFAPNYSIRPEEITIAEVLKEAGYATGHFGKWHLGPVKRESLTNPGANGFEEWLSHDNFFELNPPLVRNGGDPKVYEGESSQIVVDAATEFIKRTVRDDRPFFVVVWFGSPHGPYKGVAKDLELYNNVKDEELRHRWAEITAMDQAMGQLRDYLKSSGIAEDTLLWYCSDNGIPSNIKSYSGLREHKGAVYEGGVRVPAIIEWPAKIKRPTRTSIPCVTSDIFPTVCELLGLSLPDRPIDGISLVSLLNGKMKERPSPICFWKYDKKTETKNEPWLDPANQLGTTPTAKRDQIQFLNYKHPVAKTVNFRGDAAISDNRYKLVERSKGTVELFDIVADPEEAKDLSKEKPEIVQKMRKKLKEWQVSVERSLAGYDY